ncbi:MAG: hypothetical protein HYR56_10680 [Acidobacteria bacterium]|nr:hypothetical protein [Acidobacteriota bacterium]MBI3424076.1 hypothetical protein [Acidobacteriota bacterium]
MNRINPSLSVPCLVLAGLVLALSVYLYPAHAQSEQNPSAQEPRVSRPVPSVEANVSAQTAAPSAPAAVFTVSNLNDSGAGSLRQALLDANANGAGADTINITVNGTINLAGVLPDIASNLMINGPGANLLTVRRNTGGDYRIFQINSGVSVDLTGLTISNGSVPTGEGGGLRNSGVLTITNCAITGNLANGGGGIYNQGALAVIRSTISGNTVNFDGAGLYNVGSADVVNSTISGNTANNGTAGIININFGGPTRTLVVVNCTVTANKGVPEGGIGTYDQGGTAQTILRNTIVANNSALNLIKGGTNASVLSQGNNLASDNGGGFLTQSSDKLNTDPQLLPLGNYGGATQTHALLATSPAVDAGTTVGAPDIDQRGLARGVNGKGSGAAGFDIGAYELRSKFVNGVTGNDANSGETLALAFKTIARGIAVAVAGDDLVIAGGTYPENNLVVGKSINLQGASAATTTVNAGKLNRVFQINAGVMAGLSNLTITNGSVPTSEGGGILNSGTLVVNNCSITGNLANGGGGIFNLDGSLTISGSTLSGNTANFDGGGLYHIGNTTNVTATLTNCTISGNAGASSGIATAAASGQTATTILTNCTVAANTGSSPAIRNINFGGAIAVTTQLRNTLVAGNSGINFQIQSNTTLTSLGFNLDSDGTSGFTNTNGNVVGTAANKVDAKLGPLANNGGSTLTHALLFGSPALDKGNSSGAATDQRGVGRPVDDPGLPNATGGDGADIGAFERGGLAVVSSANFKGAPLAQESIVSVFGENLTTGTAANNGLPLPLTLLNTSVLVRDAANTARAASLFFVSPGQFNFQIPPGTSTGAATISVVRDGNLVASTNTTISAVEPGLFTANANGAGVPAAVLVRVRANGAQVVEPVAQLQGGAFVPVPISLGPVGEQVILVLFGTGIRNRSDLNAVTLTIGNAPAQGVDFAGTQGLVGLDQINSRALPRTLAGAGTVSVRLTVDGKVANVVTLNIQ